MPVIGLHLGMTGELRVEKPDYSPCRRSTIISVLRQAKRALVWFEDPRG